MTKPFPSDSEIRSDAEAEDGACGARAEPASVVVPKGHPVKEDRLAAALRANLARRKAATRAQRQAAMPVSDEASDQG
jgi:hypothetical protein